LEDAVQRLGNKAPDLRLWAEIAEEATPEGEPIWPSSYGSPNGITPKSDLIVLFLKWFDPDTQSLTGVGHIYISREKKVEELVPAILKKMNWPEKTATGEKTQLRLFEVSLAYDFAKEKSIDNRHRKSSQA
jgi:ubiquitin carboxyl-terminal hydrolase 7